MIVIPPLIEQAEELWRTLPEKFDQAQRWLVRIGHPAASRSPSAKRCSRRPTSGGATAAVSTLFGAVRNVLGGVFAIVTLVLLTFYMLVDSREIFSFFVRLFPRRHRAQVAAISATVTDKVSAWLGGQLLLALIIGSTSADRPGLMGVPYFYVLALISAVGEMIPMIGPILSAIPAILVAVTVSPGLAIGVRCSSSCSSSSRTRCSCRRSWAARSVSAPSRSSWRSASAVELLGVVGAILSVPTAAIVQVLVRSW